jgi:hypothetical protein
MPHQLVWEYIIAASTRALEKKTPVWRRELKLIELTKSPFYVGTSPQGIDFPDGTGVIWEPFDPGLGA